MMRFGTRYLRLIAPVMIFFFVWLSVRPWNFAAAASKTPQQRVMPAPHDASVPKTSPAKVSHEADLTATLKQVETALITLQTRLGKSEDASHAVAALTQLRQRLEQLDTQVHQNFIRLEQHLKAKKLPESILQRHRTMVAAYKDKLTTLLSNLVAIESANSAQERQVKTVRALAHLRAAQPPRPKPSFDPNNLPFQVPDGNIRKPRETRQEFHSALHTPPPIMVASAVLLPGLIASAAAAEPSPLPAPDDLAPTEDAPFTEDIQSLAGNLNHDPITIYKWVHDNIEFLPTYGSIQGAQLTLETKRGNAFDTASLLIALLRASNIPSRYVQGTVQVPIDKVMNWVGGVTVPEAALQVLGQGGIPNTGLVQNDAIVAVKLEHVWVEAWVDYVPSRGVANVEGDTWVPMDAAFKQYAFTEGMNLLENVPFDAEAFLNQLIASAQVNETEGWIKGLDHTIIENAVAQFQGQVNAHILGQAPEATLGDVLGAKSILKAQQSVLASSLPYRLIVRGNVFAQIPDDLRHKFRFSLYASALDRAFDTPALQFVQGLPTLASQKITLSFAPASQADADLIVSFFQGLPDDVDFLDPNTPDIILPSYLIQLVAELRVNGEVVASGGPFTMGQELVSTMGLYEPSFGWHEVDNTGIAGEYQAMAIDAAGITAEQVLDLQERLTATQAQLEAQELTALSKDQLLGDMLYTAVLSYFAVNDIADRASVSSSNVVTYRRPSFGRYTAAGQPRLLFGIALSVDFPGLEMDIDRFVSIVVSKNNDGDAQRAEVLQKGVRQSALEHVIPELFFRNANNPQEAVSAVKALEVASQQGQQIYTITSDNVSTVLPQLTVAPDVKAAIQQAVGAGRLAFVSQHDVDVGTWRGAGYILLDPETGSGAYMISGSLNGGALGVSFALGALVALMFVGSVALVGTAAVAAAAMTVSLAVIVSALVLAMTIWTVAILLTAQFFNSPAVTQDEKQCFAGGMGLSIAGTGLATLGGGGTFAGILGVIFALIVSSNSGLYCFLGVEIP